MKTDELAALCRQYGALIIGAPVDGPRLLWALSGRETSFGQGVVPLHEQAYCHGGRYYGRSRELRDATTRWGCWAHCSYGPWQTMFANMLSVDQAIDPFQAQADTARCAAAASALLGKMLAGQNPPGVREIADMWNSGNWRDDIHPLRYMDDVERYYNDAVMPV